MRVLRSCDFCEADATGTFEVLPPELNPTDDEQRRVLLCAACATRLEHLIAPLLERVGGERMGVESSSVPDKSTPPAEPSDEESADLNPIVFDAESPALDASEETQAATESDTMETDTDTDTSQTQTEATTERPAADSVILTDDDASADADATGDAESNTTQTPQSGPPRAYGKAIRLLRNREFPMERSTVEVIVGGAYDLESHEVTELLEYAIEDGRLREEGTRLDWA